MGKASSVWESMNRKNAMEINQIRVKEKIAKMNNQQIYPSEIQIDSAITKKSTIREEKTNEAFLDALLQNRREDLIVPASTKLG